MLLGHDASPILYSALEGSQLHRGSREDYSQAVLNQRAAAGSARNRGTGRRGI